MSIRGACLFNPGLACWAQIFDVVCCIDCCFVVCSKAATFKHRRFGMSSSSPSPLFLLVELKIYRIGIYGEKSTSVFAPFYPNPTVITFCVKKKKGIKGKQTQSQSQSQLTSTTEKLNNVTVTMAEKAK